MISLPVLRSRPDSHNNLELPGSQREFLLFEYFYVKKVGTGIRYQISENRQYVISRKKQDDKNVQVRKWCYTQFRKQKSKILKSLLGWVFFSLADQQFHCLFFFFKFLQLSTQRIKSSRDPDFTWVPPKSWKEMHFITYTSSSQTFWSHSSKLLRSPKSFCIFEFYLLIVTLLEIKTENLKRYIYSFTLMAIINPLR